jgi:glutamate/tyrosine decarboxylase-like PLP-dependent enzyme
VDEGLRMRMDELRRLVREDREKGEVPFMVVGTAGSVSTGAIDPLGEIAAFCREEGLWFHVDGAYGGFAAALPDAPADLAVIAEADSIAVDPHKWLYAPLEAGCALVRDPEALRAAFSYQPVYYQYSAKREEQPINYHEYGPQNTRGFRALKVWLGLAAAGRDGYVRMISDDIRLSNELAELVARTPGLENVTQALSITTYRYVPPGLPPGAESETYLNDLNGELMRRIRASGSAYVSNAVVHGKFALRACIVNFRTSREDIESLPELTVRLGREADAEMRPDSLAMPSP